MSIAKRQKEHKHICSKYFEKYVDRTHFFTQFSFCSPPSLRNLPNVLFQKSDMSCLSNKSDMLEGSNMGRETQGPGVHPHHPGCPPQSS